MNQLLNKKNSIYSKLNYILISILPISLFVGSFVSNTVILFISIFFIIDLIQKKNFFIIKDSNFKFLIIIYLYLIVNSVLISYNSDSLFKTLVFIRFFILSYAIYYYFHFFKKDFIRIWFLIFLIVSFDIFFEFYMGKNILGFSSNYHGRVASFSGDELKVGGYYFGFLFLAMAFFENNKKLFIIFLIIFLLAALLIGERSNFIKIFLMCIFFFLFFTNISKLKKLTYILILATITILTINNVPHLKGKFYHHVFDVYLKKIEGNKKLDYETIVKSNQYLSHYHAALMISRDNFLFGSGYKTFRFESHKDQYTKDGFFGASTHPHQIHFEILSEIGVVGYLLIMSNLIFLLYKQRRSDKSFLTKSSILFILASLFPLLPSGSFFTSYGATIFFINYSFLIRPNQINYN